MIPKKSTEMLLLKKKKKTYISVLHRVQWKIILFNFDLRIQTGPDLFQRRKWTVSR